VTVRRLRLFLDANILHAAALRDFFLRMAEGGEIDVLWSKPVLEETRRSLQRRGLPSDKIDRLVVALEGAFPNAEVRGFEHLTDRLECPDPQDRHVLAAAVVAAADILVTDDRSGFRIDTFERHDIQVLRGDEVASFLVVSFPGAAVAAFRQQIADLTNPSCTEEQFLDRIECTAPMFARTLGSHLGVERFVRLAMEDEADPLRPTRPAARCTR
jgi:predicted nucleic acid-binding protein